MTRRPPIPDNIFKMYGIEERVLEGYSSEEEKNSSQRSASLHIRQSSSSEGKRNSRQRSSSLPVGHSSSSSSSEELPALNNLLSSSTSSSDSLEERLALYNRLPSSASGESAQFGVAHECHICRHFYRANELSKHIKYCTGPSDFWAQ